mgnify:CR=1 FL=1
MEEQIIKTEYSELMQKSYIDYAMSVIVARALPDVRDGLKAQKSDKARAAYRQKHESDFIIADAAAQYFREHGIKKLPTYKSLQAEIEQLTADKNARYNDYREKKERVRELQTVKGNIDQMMRGAPSQQKRHEHDR